MAVTEYTGARYVPIFGRVGEDSIAWDNSKAYEPLTIVTHEGNSYTSRQYVPVGIGIDNEEFWALTGNYNAQVEQYRRDVASFDGRITANAQGVADNDSRITSEVSTLNSKIADNKTAIETNAAKITANSNTIASNTNRIEALEDNGCIVIIGDSWSDENNDGSNPWPYIVATKLGMTKINCAVAGTGFVVGSQNFSVQTNTILPQKLQAAGKTYDDVKIILIVGGVNDYRWGYNYTEIITGFNTAVNPLLDNCPNARIIFCGINTGVFTTMDSIDAGPNKRTSYAQFPELNKNICTGINNNPTWNRRVEVIEDFWLWLCNYGPDMKNVFKSDMLHPNEGYGQSIIANNMLSVIRGSYHNYTQTVYANEYTREIDFTTETGTVTRTASITSSQTLIGALCIFTAQLEFDENVTPTAQSILDIAFRGTGRFYSLKNIVVNAYDFNSQVEVPAYIATGTYVDANNLCGNSYCRLYFPPYTRKNGSAGYYKSIYLSGIYSLI